MSYQNNSKQTRTLLDSGQLQKNSYLEKEEAFKTVQANHLVPNEFYKVTLTYNSDNNIETATYYDLGTKQVYSLIPRPDKLSSPETSLISFMGKHPTDLYNNGFIIYDDAGSVAVVMRRQGTVASPVIAGDRFLYIDLVDADNDFTIAKKVSYGLNNDGNFISVSADFVLSVRSITNGNKLNTKSTVLDVETKDGEDALPLNNTYFLVYRPDGLFHYFWFNVDSLGTDPSVALAFEGHEIAILSTDSLRTVINKMVDVINSSIYFHAFSDPNSKIVNIVNNQPGVASNIDAVNTGFTHVKTITTGVASKPIRKIFLQYNANGDVIDVESI